MTFVITNLFHIVLIWICAVNFCFATDTTYSMCENDIRQLNCSSGKYLEVTNMLFGRQDNVSCPTPNNRTDLDNIMCPTPINALQRLQTYCNGKRSCYFIAGQQQWGQNIDVRSCLMGGRRQASVTFTCRDCTNQENDSYCEAWEKQNKCKTDYVNMMQKCYKTCSKCGQKDCGNTYNGGGPHVCDNWAMWVREECTFSPGFMLPSCNESCLCNTLNTDTKVSLCESESHEIICNTSEYIQIKSMFYGRNDNTACPDNQNNTHNRNVTCSTPAGSLEKLRLYCNGRHRCWFIASDDQWGEDESKSLCMGMHSVAEVTYTCKACTDRGGSWCNQLVQEGKCESEYDLMMERCYKSCTKCGQKDCGNINSDNKVCDGKAMNQIPQCTAASGFMLQFCNESCLCNTTQLDVLGNLSSTNISTTTTATTAAAATTTTTTAAAAATTATSQNGSVPTGHHYDITVRLTGGHEGRVEITYNNETGTVCDDNWTHENCKVVCKELGYSGGLAYCCAAYHPGTGRIWLDHVDCDGTEASIIDCHHNGWGVHNCEHSEDASCQCGSGNVQIIP